ncbi:MAG TPA: LOG family protein [Candidatus Avipropionibacterium avicola]|uniref:LOG family protein n=1 Tax=Candidatus Avipropionibacterium avicola TaxID=2840701 RepID=A0A9D1GUE5_9ACTN|nr:LOG family protein [Candidatus Avipropionibacterium avicola]
MSRRHTEIEDLTDFDDRIGLTRSLNGWFLQSVDLSERSGPLSERDVTGAVFLGCTFADGVENLLRLRGALIFPSLPQAPFNPYRASLYDADELYGDGPYSSGTDAAVYAWSQHWHREHDLRGDLAITLHDHAITEALDDAIGPDVVPETRLVGVMGGHALRRGEPGYRQACELGARLTEAGRIVLTGGGPGAMEAANLGAYLSGQDDPERACHEALAVLAEHADFHHDLDGWAAAAMEVRRRWPAATAGHSVGIPTWFYGHEPPNAFATRIAKYFTNALREDTLLARCRGGIIYLPGAAGTVQEVFQAVTENYYAAHEDNIAPLVLVDTEHWTRRLPVWPLLQALGQDRAMGERIHCVDTVDQALAVLTG